jgi:sarcosine oxidase subunit beta
MADTADVVVIGGGVIGTSIAFALASAGIKRVVLLEKSALASGASGRSSALVRMHYTNIEDARLAWASYPVFRDWTERMGGPPVFRRTGVVAVVGPDDAPALRSNVEMLRGLGVETVALSPAELKTLQPFVNVDDVGAAAYEPASGYASPADVVEGFRRQAQARGADIRQWTPVTRLLRRESAVTGVETPAGRIDAGAVVVAAGAWAPRLCNEIGLPIAARPKALDTMLVTRPPEMATPHMVVLDHVLGTYFRPESDVLTIAGVPCQVWDVDPDTMATGLPPSAPVEGAQLLTQRFPAMEHAELARGYRAFDCYSADRHAILGAARGIDGLYLATAFSGSGFKIAPAVGTCLAELITEGRARTVDISAFRPERFAEGKLIAGRHLYKPRRDHVDPAGGAAPISLSPPTAEPETGLRYN